MSAVGGQRTAIRGWSEKAKAEPQLRVLTTIPIENTAGKGFEGGGSGGAPPPTRNWRVREWVFLLLSAAVLLAVFGGAGIGDGEELESGLETNEQTINP